MPRKSKRGLCRNLGVNRRLWTLGIVFAGRVDRDGSAWETHPVVHLLVSESSAEPVKTGLYVITHGRWPERFADFYAFRVAKFWDKFLHGFNA